MNILWTRKGPKRVYARVVTALHTLTLYQSLHAILFVITRWRHYW